MRPTSYARPASFSSPMVHLRRDDFGRFEEIRTEELTAISLLLLALLAVGIMLYALRLLLIPFAVAVLLTYLLQPLVNALLTPPRRCLRACTSRRAQSLYSSLASRLSVSRSGHSYGSIPQDEPPVVSTPAAPASSAAEVDSDREEEHRARGWRDEPLFPRWFAVVVAILVAVGIVLVVCSIVYFSVQQLQGDWAKYDRGGQILSRQLNRWLKEFGISWDEDFVPYILRYLKDLTPMVFSTIFEFFGHMLLVVIFVVYLLMAPPRPLPPGVWQHIDVQVRKYIRVKTLVCLAVGFWCGLVLQLVGVDLAWVFGLLSFVLNFIPNVGPLVATLLPMPMVLLDPDLSTTSKVLAFLLPSVVHLYIGNFVEPMLFGDHLTLHPVVVLLSLAFWGVLWGVAGMILSVPLLAIIRIVCLHLDHPYARIVVLLIEGRVFEIQIKTAEQADTGRISPSATLRQTL